MSLKSVDRALQILFAFRVDERLLGVNELSERLDIHPSTVHNLASTLVEWGILEQDPASRKYRLGIRLIELGGTMLQSRSLAQSIQPYLHHIADELGETTYLGVLNHTDLLNVEQVCGPHRIQYAGWQGRRTPFYCTSAGKAIVAYLPEFEQNGLLEAVELQQFTNRTVGDIATLRRELEVVRTQGYAMSIGEMDENINAIAVPVKGLASDSSTVIAAIGVAGPSYRFKEADCLEALGFLKSVAQDVSGRVHVADFDAVGAFANEGGGQ